MPEEWVPMQIYCNGKRLKEDLWEINGIQYEIQRKKETIGESLKLVPHRWIDKLRCLLGVI